MVKKASIKEIIILAALLGVLLNYLFFRYIYPITQHKRNTLIATIDRYDREIDTQINNFQSNLHLLQKIAMLKRKILFSKKNLEILQTSNVSTFDMANILKALLIKSGVGIYDITLSGTKSLNDHKIYSFKVQINDSLKKLVHFMDLVENYSDNMYITNYELKPTPKSPNGYYSMSISVNFDYVRLQK